MMNLTEGVNMTDYQNIDPWKCYLLLGGVQVHLQTIAQLVQTSSHAGPEPDREGRSRSYH